MTFALSTNWCNRRIASGREIAELAKALGFASLELGFHTTDSQAREIREAAVLPVTSVHAFCPVPISAPQGYPELYQLASFAADGRRIAAYHVRKNIEFAASMGATALVLHAGRVRRGGLFAKRRSRKLVEIAKRELAALVPDLERTGVRLGLENLPYAEGFPNVQELKELVGDWVRPWYDTGHGFVRGESAEGLNPLGVHINDSNGGDDHLPPGEGKIDFAALAPIIAACPHRVFEPHAEVSEAALSQGLEKMVRLAQERTIGLL